LFGVSSIGQEAEKDERQVTIEFEHGPLDERFRVGRRSIDARTGVFPTRERAGVRELARGT
jgi:hypothetical protein